VDRVLPTVAIIVVLIVVLLLILMGWRRRVRRDRDAGAGYPEPSGSSTPLAEIGALYVATTKAGEPLERLALPGLAFRGNAAVSVSGDGVRIAVTGEPPVFIIASALTGVGAATVAIDRVVERDGLVRISWLTSGGAAADSYFRVVDPAGRAQLTAAIEQIVPRADAPDEAGPSRPNDKEV
jgi:hypothetical protein